MGEVFSPYRRWLCPFPDRSPNQRRGQQESGEESAGSEDQSYDTHPPLRHRITATESLPELSAQEDARPATDLLDQLQNLEQQFIEDRVSNIKPGTLKYVSWDEVDRRVRIPSWQKAVATHAAVLKGVTAESIPDQIPRFPEIGARIPDPKGMLLTSKQRTQRAAQVFAAALVLALIENRWELCVQPGIFRLRRGSDGLNPSSWSRN